MSAIDLLYARRRRASLSQSSMLERVAYHGTSKANLQAIRAVGLVPKVGDNTTNDEGRDVEAKVCLALDKSTATSYAKKSDDGGVVLAVNLEEPEVKGAAPQNDKFTPGSITVNQRIPPDAIQVIERKNVGHRIARITEADAPEVDSSTKVSQEDWRPSAERLALDSGFLEQYRQDHGRLGTVVKYFHPRGDQLIITRREDLAHPVGQFAHYTDRLKGSSGNWETRWEYHTIDGTKSTGFDVWGLKDHLSRMT